MNIINLIIFCSFGFSLLILLYLLIKSNIQKRKILSLFIQSEMDRYFINQKLDETFKELSTLKLSENDGFIKFISDSRDWAFGYIEQVQYAHREFDETVTSIAMWNDVYGADAESTLLREKLTEISLAYEKLKSFLPKDNETPNN